jgi:hypothetical protein
LRRKPEDHPACNIEHSGALQKGMNLLASLNILEAEGLEQPAAVYHVVAIAMTLAQEMSVSKA